jgi:hypothetical protein
LPQLSVALQVLVILFTGVQDPPTVTSENVKVGVPQLSVAVGLPVLEGAVLAEHSIVILAGHVIIGAWLSSIAMIWLQVELLPQLSVAVHVLVIVLSCGHEPPIVTSPKVMIGAESTLSVAVALPVLEGAVLAVHSIVIFGGHVIKGGDVSTVTVMESTTLHCVPVETVT